jgi:hypothetical protein
VYNEEYQGIVTGMFYKKIKDTREDIKTKKQMHNELTIQLSLEIDKAFDEYIENKLR